MLRSASLSLLAVPLLSGGAPPTPPQLPVWVMAVEAQHGFGELWTKSTAAHRERVACLGGRIGEDSVWVDRVRAVDAGKADSLTAPAERSIDECAPPQWMGTVHTHVRSTDDPNPAPRFSAGDRRVMSAWSTRWATRGAFCVVYSARAAHCEVYPTGARPGATASDSSAP